MMTIKDKFQSLLQEESQKKHNLDMQLAAIQKRARNKIDPVLSAVQDLASVIIDHEDISLNISDYSCTIRMEQRPDSWVSIEVSCYPFIYPLTGDLDIKIHETSYCGTCPEDNYRESEQKYESAEDVTDIILRKVAAYIAKK